MEAKADSLVQEAEAELKKWSFFGGGSKYEDAADKFKRAGNAYKAVKQRACRFPPRAPLPTPARSFIIRAPPPRASKLFRTPRPLQTRKRPTRSSAPRSNSR